MLPQCSSPSDEGSGFFDLRAGLFADLMWKPERLVDEPEVLSNAFGREAELLGRVLVAAGVTALSRRLLPHFFDESLCGLYLDEIEDAFHGRLEVVDQILVAHHAQFAFGDLARRLRLVEIAQHVA